ncbi:UNKNOWN [Stylonychia lemnae]|uniref:Transmembrane protein n=1 Tax=Stylonychia lemnae TaxID=5949 RepID=A0A078A4B5_STYLE|nr:UNKNOWN [Stylonychia lemnae]|eukprot:CDW77007.1 UNKNOWN [Stylonychia lemnae]
MGDTIEEQKAKDIGKMNLSRTADVDPKINEKFNSKTIHNLTYDEIIKYNKERNKGTFIDRSWRDQVNEDDDLDNPNTTRWEKFKAGRYNFGNFTRTQAKKLAIKQQKVEFIEKLVNNKNKYEDDRDKLILRNLEIKVMAQYNLYRYGMLISAVGFCIFNLSNTKKSIHSRLFPVIFIGTFASFYNHQVGMYGVYQKLDKFLAFVAEKQDTQVGQEAGQFINEMNLTNKQKQELKENQIQVA